ncbi:MAG: tyrosine-type recombinase/integrase [Planctomycetota bacterium]|jgi:integrase
MAGRRRVPSYRLHKPSGRAVVTLGGKDVYLGRHGSEASREEYDRVVAEWLANGREPPKGSEERPALTIRQVIRRYWRHARSYYVKDGKPSPEQFHLKSVVKVVRRLYGRTLAEEFGPLALKSCREELVLRGLCRRTINQHVGRVKRMFRWAVAEELVPASVLLGLQSVEGLRRGRSDAREGRKVCPVPEEHIEAVLPHLSAAVRAMVELQCLTGMRPGEVIIMRGSDLDCTNLPWAYRPSRHKTEHHGHERVVYLGPRARDVLAPFLEDGRDGYLFSPREAEEARNAKRTMANRGNHTRRPRKADRRRPWREHYDSSTYRRAIQRACKKAVVPSWHPHQLRHNAATRLREEFGIEAARVVLGHRSAAVTEIYAELDRDTAARVMAQVG